jgi:hypothetical protein
MMFMALGFTVSSRICFEGGGEAATAGDDAWGGVVPDCLQIAENSPARPARASLRLIELARGTGAALRWLSRWGKAGWGLGCIRLRLERMLLLIGIVASTTSARAARLLFEDAFTSSSLKRTSWSPYMCDALSKAWPWCMLPGQPQPSSAISEPNGVNADYDLPSSISTGSGLVLTAQNGTTAGGYSWTSEVICSFPTTNQFGTTPGFTFTNGYVEVRAKMPYAGNGYWPGIWFLSGPGENGGEIDLHEGGYFLESCSRSRN